MVVEGNGGRPRHPVFVEHPGMVDANTFVELLRLLEKVRGNRPYSSDVLSELVRIVPRSVVEMVILRTRQGVDEVMVVPELRQEGPQQIVYQPLQLTVVSSDFKHDSHNPLNGAFARMEEDVLKTRFAYAPEFAVLSSRVDRRGATVQLSYYTELKDSSAVRGPHRWHPINEPIVDPAHIPDSLPHIIDVAKSWRTMKNNSK